MPDPRSIVGELMCPVLYPPERDSTVPLMPGLPVE